jgi:DNA invertase Pin-like site-specific DNA recombinase
MVFRLKVATMGQIWGYARVSTGGQDVALQVDALRAAGVPDDRIVRETISGAKADKPLLDRLVGKLKAGDSLTVWKVDRLGRSVLDALLLVKRLDEAGVAVVITTLGIDLTTPAGRLVLGMMLQIAEFERELIRERTNAGLAATKARGTVLGRRHSLTTHQRAEAARMVLDEGKSLGDVSQLLRVGRTIVHRAVTEVRAARATTGGFQPPPAF